MKTQNRRIPGATWLIGLALVAGCTASKPEDPAAPGDAGPVQASDSGVQASSSPIYFTIFTHNERTLSRYGSLRENEEDYQEFRTTLLQVATMLHDYGAKYSWQTDYVFLEAYETFEDTLLAADLTATNGKPMLRYLVEDLGVSVEAHAHDCISPSDYPSNACVEEGKAYNYADVAYLIETLGEVTPPPLVGGITARPLSYFADCVVANEHPYTWCPEIVTGYNDGRGHVPGADDFTSGVWRPSELRGDAFHEHNASSNILFIGNGAYFTEELAANWHGKEINNRDYINALIEQIETGQAPQDQIYTVSLFLAEFTNRDYDGFETLESYLRDFLKPLIDDGKLVPMTFPQVAQVWASTFDSRPNVYEIDNF